MVGVLLIQCVEYDREIESNAAVPMYDQWCVDKGVMNEMREHLKCTWCEI